MSSTSYSPVRISDHLKRDLNALAIQKGMQVQELLELAVKDYLNSEQKPPPDRGSVIRCIKGLEIDMRQDGIANVYLFGSVATGQEHCKSDIDIAADFGSKAPSMIKISKWKHRIEAHLGGAHKVDLVPLKQMREEVMKDAAKNMIKIF